jgi:hypothetical protein
MRSKGIRGPQGAGLVVATLVLMQALVLLTASPVLAAGDNDPGTGTWAEDGSVFRDQVRLSADDPAADPEDWYRINLTAGASELDFLTIRINLTGYYDERYFVWAGIHDPDGAELQEVQATTYMPEYAKTLCHRTGVYLVRVYTYTKYDCQYELSFTVEKRANVTDGDDTLGEATLLEPPATAMGHIHGVFDPFDHYYVNLTRNSSHYEFLEVRLAPDRWRRNQDLDLFLIVIVNGTPQVVAASLSNGSIERAWFGATEGDMKVYIRVHAYGGNTSYNVTVTKIAVPDDGNNNFEGAVLLDDDSRVNESLEPSDPLDFFKVNLTGGDLVTVNVTAKGYDPAKRKPNFNLYFYSPAKWIVNWSFSYDPMERVTYEVPMGEPAAEYYILVTFHDPTPSDGVPAYGGYVINITINHAAYLLPAGHLTTDEDTPLVMPLVDLLMDDDGPEMDAKVQEADNLTVTMGVDDLTITPAANFSGNASFVLRVWDGVRTVHLTQHVSVAPVPDAPMAVHPLPQFSLEEDSSISLDLEEYFVDGDGDPLNFTGIMITGGPLEGTSLDGSNLTVVPAADFFGEASMPITATDPTNRSGTATLSFLVEPVEDPPAVIWPEANVTADEDQRGVEVDLGEVFSDPDGDELAYTVDEADHLAYILLGGLLIVDPEADFAGSESLTVTASDGHGGQAVASIVFTFRAVNDRPVILSRDPEGAVSLTEGEAQVFTVGASDPEGVTLTYDWFLDVEPLDESLARYEMVTDHSSQGTHLVSLRVSDGDAETWVNWTVEVENVNRPPTVEVLKPKDGADYEEGDNVVFEADARDPDEEALSVQWFVDDEEVGTGTVFTTSKLKPGKYTARVVVTDPHQASVNTTVGFEVKESSGVPGPSLAASALTLAVVALIFVTSRRFCACR